MINTPALVSETENVVRILHRDWVVNGILQHYAFVLRRNEAYISVNRPVVPSFDADVASFVTHHPDYFADENKMRYRRAVLNVGAIRQTEVKVNDIKLDIDVEVEPRDMFAKFACRNFHSL